MHASTKLEERTQQLNTNTVILSMTYDASREGLVESSQLETKRIGLFLSKILKIPLHSHFSRIWRPELFQDGSVGFCNVLDAFGNTGVATLVLVVFRIPSLCLVAPR